MLIGVALLALLVASCAQRPPERAAPKQEGAEIDCAKLWTEVREDALASGVDDGTARRLADQARLECETANGGLPSPEVTPDYPCAKDAELRGAAPSDTGPKMVGVYLSCKADFARLGTRDQPVYLAMREIPSALTGTHAERVEGAVRAYMAGPTPEEQDRGYFAASPPSLANAIESVNVEGGQATIDFAPRVAGNLGNLGTTTATDVFVNELGATVFQFKDIDRLILRIEGDCDAFWRLLERTCTVIERPA